MYGKRILVLVPHPDDEAVGAALAIRRAVAAGNAVTLIDLTHGCPPHAASAERVAQRRREAAAAAAMLGAARIPDGGLPARALRQTLPEAFRRVITAIEAHAADTLWVPAYEGAHPDHDCANALAFAALRARPGLAAWEFAEYHNAGGKRQTNTFPDRRGGEIELEADAASGEARVKAAVLGCYASERFNLRNVVGTSTREAFRTLPAHDYARPPHPGRLFYARFHWVPFRVKQIDFTTSAEVSIAIGTFLAGIAA